jgi:hypothetical protein
MARPLKIPRRYGFQLSGLDERHRDDSASANGVSGENWPQGWNAGKPHLSKKTFTLLNL